MRVLLVNTSENTGGAAIAALRLLNALNRQDGVEARMLVRDTRKPAPGKNVLTYGPRLTNRLRFLAERLYIFAANGFSRKNLFAIDTATHGTDITRLPAFREADIIHLHWVNQGMLSLTDLRRLLQTGKPVVWTLHDMWPLTGICHQAGDCPKWRTGCGNCPLLNHPRPNDLSATTFRRKETAYRHGNLRLVTCSDWLRDIAMEAPLRLGRNVRSIPNAINTDFYAPADKKAARRALGLPADKRIILFVAFKVTDPNKGIGYLLEALRRIVRENNIGNLCLVPVGREAGQLAGTAECEVLPFDYVSDRGTMRQLYSAADVLAMPTLMDNLPNTIVEGMACGLPCAGFEVGGLPQMIDHGKNGYLARFKDAADLARGLLFLLQAANYDEISRRAREKAANSYSEKTVAAKYLACYHECLAATDTSSQRT